MQPPKVNPEATLFSLSRLAFLGQPPLEFMTRKQDRQNAILRLVGQHQIANQEELKRLLSAQGLVVTQATLSRDLHDLGVVRAPTEDGSRYMLPEMVADESKPSLEQLLPQWFSRID